MVEQQQYIPVTPRPQRRHAEEDMSLVILEIDRERRRRREREGIINRRNGNNNDRFNCERKRRTDPVMGFIVENGQHSIKRRCLYDDSSFCPILLDEDDEKENHDQLQPAPRDIEGISCSLRPRNLNHLFIQESKQSDILPPFMPF